MPSRHFRLSQGNRQPKEPWRPHARGIQPVDQRSGASRNRPRQHRPVACDPYKATCFSILPRGLLLMASVNSNPLPASRLCRKLLFDKAKSKLSAWWLIHRNQRRVYQPPRPLPPGNGLLPTTDISHSTLSFTVGLKLGNAAADLLGIQAFLQASYTISPIDNSSETHTWYDPADSNHVIQTRTIETKGSSRAVPRSMASSASRTSCW